MKRFNRMLRPLALLLTMLMMLGMFSACAASGDVVMEFGKQKITANMYAFWLSRYKAFFVYQYMNNSENAAMWDAQVKEDGTTLNEMFTAYVKENVRTYAAALYLYDSYQLKLSAAAKADIEKTMEEMVEAAGSKAALNAELANYAVNYNMLKEIYTIETKVNQLQEYLFAAGGPAEITAAQKNAYYTENYACLKHIFVNTSAKYVEDETGSYKTDSEGNYLTEALTEEEIAAKKEKQQEILAKLTAGEDFETLLPVYTEDSATEVYPDGYFFTRTSNYVSQVIDALFEMEIGEWRMVESELGYHFIKRLPLPAQGYAASANEDFFTDFTSNLTVQNFTTFLTPYMEDVIVHDDIADLYSLKTVTANYRY